MWRKAVAVSRYHTAHSADASPSDFVSPNNLPSLTLNQISRKEVSFARLALPRIGAVDSPAGLSSSFVQARCRKLIEVGIRRLSLVAGLRGDANIANCADLILVQLWRA